MGHLRLVKRSGLSPEHTKWLNKIEAAHRRAEVLVEKHRHGATNKIDLYFDDRFTRFSSVSDRND